MTPKSIVALLAVACIAALGFVLLSDSDPVRGDQTISRSEVERNVTPVSEEDVTLDPAVAAAPIARREAAPTSVEVATASVDLASHPWSDMLAGVTGRVVEEDGTPVVGMRVELLEGDASLMLDPEHTAMGRPNIDVGETKTDGDGRFTIEGATVSAFHVLALDGGGGRATVRFVEQALESGVLTDIGDIVLPDFGTVIGVVLDEDGEPVAGARVRLAPIPEPALQSGVLDLREDCSVAFGTDEFMNVEIPQWIMANMDRLPVPTTTTNADGEFRLVGVPLTVVAGGVDHAGYVATIITPFEMNVEEYDLDEIDLEVGRTVTGRVVDELGDPIAGAEVRAGALHPVFNVGILQPSVVTDEEGAFEVPGINDIGKVLASARRDAREEWVIAQAGGGSSVVSVVLPAAAPLVVRATNEAGEPVEGAQVTLRSLAEENNMMNMGVTAMLGVRARPASYTVEETEPGVYQMGEIGLGKWAVKVEAEGHAPTEIQVEHLSKATECDVTCRGARAITVTVVDKATGEPVPSAHARVIGPSETLFGAQASAFTDESGTARLSPLARPGEESVIGGMGFLANFEPQLTVEHPRYGFQTAALPKDSDEVTVELTPACVLTGRVTWAGTVPTEIYMVALTAQNRGRDDISEAFATPRTTITNLEGGFRYTGLSEGEYQVMLFERFLDSDPFEFIIKQQEPEMIYRATVEVTAGEENVVEVVLGATGEGPKAVFAGRVVVEGEPVIGAKVSINGKDDQELQTDAFGEFESEPVPAIGWYNVEIEGEVLLPDGTRGEKTLYDEWTEPDSGGVHRIDIDIDYEPFVVEVIDASTGAPAEGLWVRVGGGDAVKSDAEGRARLLIEKTGNQTVAVNGDGYANYRKRLDCDPTQPEPQIRVEVLPSVPCAGRVVLPNGRTSSDWVGLMIYDEDGDQNWHSVNNEDLTFRINNMMPGTYSAQVWSDGTRTGKIDFELGPNGDENLVLQFDSGG